MDDISRQDINEDNQEAAQQPAEALSTQATRSKRDEGKAGGGMIPNLPDIHTDKTNDEAKLNDGLQKSNDPTNDQKAHTAGDAPPTNDARAINRQSESNAATRGPEQPQTAMGDQDRTFGGRGTGANEEIIDPMTSRAPDKVNAPPSQQNT